MRSTRIVTEPIQAHNVHPENPLQKLKCSYLEKPQDIKTRTPFILA